MIFGKSDPNQPSDTKTNGNPVPETGASTLSAAPPHAPAPTPAHAAAAGGTPAQASLRYVDRPDTAETFADSITSLFFDGQMLRIEFAVTRLDEIKQNAPITGRRYPACRLILPATAAVDLINRMQQVGTALTQAGIVKPTPPAKP